MRTILAIRHGHSTANAVTEIPPTMTAAELAFENRNAKLTAGGEGDVKKLATRLLPEYGVVVADTRLAVSKYARTQQTGVVLGFRPDLTTSYPVLNEVEHGMGLQALRAQLRQNQIPSVAMEAAAAVLEQQPPEAIWVTHGLLIAGLCAVLKTVDQYEQAVPQCCEVRQLTF